MMRDVICRTHVASHPIVESERAGAVAAARPRQPRSAVACIEARRGTPTGNPISSSGGPHMIKSMATVCLPVIGLNAKDSESQRGDGGAVIAFSADGCPG